MTSSSPTQEALNAAYATEINDCSFNVDLGTRVRSRDQSFCASVEIAGTLNVASTATFASPINVAGAVVVDGIPYMPAALSQPGAVGAAGIAVSILTANGVPITFAAPTPPGPPAETFTSISVTNTADFNNVTITGTATGVFDAGAY